jgi:HK97 family phage major capsid protein
VKTLRELVEELESKRQQLHKIFEEAGPDLDLSKVTSITGTTAEKAAEIKRRNDELADLQRQVEERKALEAVSANVKAVGDYLNEPVNRPLQPGGNGGGPTAPIKSLGQYVVESEEFKAILGQAKKTFAVEHKDFEFKTLFQTSAGFPPETTRTGRIVEAALRPIQVLDIIPSTPTDQAAVVYMRETVTTIAAAERAEGGAYAEAALSYAEDSSTVRSIGVSLPITDEQLEDVPGVQGMIDGRLLFFLRQRLDGQVLTGSGVAPNLTGVLNVGGIQTQAKGTDPVFDAVHKAITLVTITGRASPSAIVMHPNDWQDLRLTRTADGIYILGNPSDPSLTRLWGLPVVISDAETENTALVGDFVNHCELRPRRGAEVEVGFNSGDFVAGKQTIRAGLRVAFVVYRAAAFCTVTGI